MAFEERYLLLLSRVHDEYNEMVQNANFMDGDVEKLAEDITVAKTLQNAIELPSFSEAYSDVETLLFYEKPLTAACEQFRENRLSLWNGLSAPFDSFLRDTRHHITEILNQWTALPMDEMARAEDYRTMDQKIGEYYQENEERLLKRERWLETYHDNIERDLLECQKYLKRYEEIRGEPNIAFENVVSDLHKRMLAFDDFTDRQLQAVSQIEEPLTYAYRCLSCLEDGDTRTEILDRIILGMAKAQTAMLKHEETKQEQDYDLER
nr:hypothetical protein [uncultured Clostridium sp.]